MSATTRLVQARLDALAGIVGELTDAEISAAVPDLEVTRALEIARTGIRGARVVVRSVGHWPDEVGGDVLDVWKTLIRIGDRVGIDAMVYSLPASVLPEALGIGGKMAAWEAIDSRVQGLNDTEWLDIVVAARWYANQLLGAALGRREMVRVEMALECPALDSVSTLAYLANTREIDSWLAERLETPFERLLARFGRVHRGLIDLPTGDVADADAARVLAKSRPPGLRRLAARSASSDSLVRARLLDDDDPSIDAALCMAPLNANELERLMARLRSREAPPLEAEHLLFQPDPLSTKDRLWLLRSGRTALTRAWITGQSAQDPRRGEIELLFKSPGRSLVGDNGESPDTSMLLRWAQGTEWADDLESALYASGLASSGV